MKRINYNPDILTCLANLSNDEVFTQPKIANQMLDMLPKELWKDKNAKFLDPACKSGVFLREIAKRLMEGLKEEIPNDQERRDHIFKNQVYGIAITELTALLSRRSVYCSKLANGKYSVTDSFKTPEGNIKFTPTRHNWQNGICVFCGASQAIHERDEELETHAYEFIHTLKPEETFKMKFDVIIGNPPYQLNDGGGMGTSAMPLYQKFVQQAKRLNPRYLSMIIPSRWFAGGKGLDEFRNEMLTDNRIREICDYFDPKECFPGIDLSGGVCYFLWDRDNSGECKVTSIIKGNQSVMVRKLLENNNDTFIRFNEAISIIRKVKSREEKSFNEYISSRKPFGIDSTISPETENSINSVKIYAYPNNGYIDKNRIMQNRNLIDKYKVYIAKAYGERGDFPYLVISKPFIGEPNSCCSETYLLIGPFENKMICENVISYIKTKFFRFFVLLKKNTQNAAKGVYSLLPMQDFTKPWTDEELYKKYELVKEEIEFIESMIRPMNGE